MEGLISAVLSLLGLGQQSAHASSAKRNEASKLNAEFEFLLRKTAEYLRSEQVHLHHRINEIADDPNELREPVDKVVGTLLAEIEVGLATAANSRNTILSGSSFASLARWDEAISLLHQQKCAAELQYERSKLCIGQFHRVLNNAIDPDTAGRPVIVDDSATLIEPN